MVDESKVAARLDALSAELATQSEAVQVSLRLLATSLRKASLVRRKYEPAKGHTRILMTEPEARALLERLQLDVAPPTKAKRKGRRTAFPAVKRAQETKAKAHLEAFKHRIALAFRIKLKESP